MKARGLQFLSIPKAYYTQLRKNLENAKITIAEDMNEVK